jgi:hypothetical protein
MLAAAAAVLLSVAACARETGAGTGSPSPAASGGTVTVVRSGGLAGVHDEFVVDPSGTWTVTDRTGGRRTGHLTDQQRATLARLATDPRLPDEARRTQGPSHCADVYAYAVTVNAVRISFVDCAADDGRPATAAAIVTLVTQAVPS